MATASTALLPPPGRSGTAGIMKLQDIEREALVLSEVDRASLVLSLMETLVAPGSDVDDREVLRRDAQLEAGEVSEITHEEFVSRVRNIRRR